MAQGPRVSKVAAHGNSRGAHPRPAHPRPGSYSRTAAALAFLDDPRTRVASIPIFLWVCAAVVAHLMGGGGAMEAAQLVRERDELKAAVRAERAVFRPQNDTFELLPDNVEPTPQTVEPPKEDAPADTKGETDPDAVKDPTKAPPVKVTPEVEKPKPEPKPETPKPEAEKPKAPPPKPLAPVVATPAPPAPPPPPLPDVDHRQAVKQNVKPNQEDNKNANRIADEANKVDDEHVARARAQDQDSPKPSMGGSTGGPHDEVGNDKEAHSGSAENHKGNENHAPGEAKKAATDAEHERPAPPVPPTPKPGSLPSAPGAPSKGGKGSAPKEAAPPASPGGAGPSSPEVTAGDNGGYTLDPANPGGDGKSKRPGRKRAPSPFETPVHPSQALGLGGTGLPGAPKMNLDMPGVEAAVGNEQLARERAADGAARRAAHRGRWEKNKFDKWRPAIENYEPSVKLDNTTALNAARSPFATYLVTIHNRIHPIFAEQYLDFLNGRPKGDKINDMTLFTSLEIVLDKNTGKIVRMGVTKTSGITEYDITALASVDKAQPFGKAPDIIASPDGNVYLHWEFHRDPFDACTTRNARPFLLKDAPKKAVPAGVGPLRKPAASDDRSAPSGPLAPGR
jgi:hypothetical protein